MTISLAQRYLICFLWLCSAGAAAQEKCRAEVKLLLLPSQAQSAAKSLQAGKGVAGEVYFFDTPTLALLSQGIIVRVRRRATTDLTVKLRPSPEKEIRNVSGHHAKFKCEWDMTGGTAVRSYSVQSQLGAAPPESGKEILAMLNTAQKDLLAQVSGAIDWGQIKRIAEIKSTDWLIYNQPMFPKLVMELWEWPTGSVLELSTKVWYDSAPAADAGLQRLAAAKGLSLSSQQKSKTTLALEELVHVTVP